METTRFATEYLPALRLCRCVCGWHRMATSDADADRVLAEHTTAHEALALAGVSA